MEYVPAEDRYDQMIYRRSGRSGLRLPVISLGMWHNFGDVDDFITAKEIAFKAFDLGICHFDLANNYGPSPGSAETNFGHILKLGLAPYRDELIISSKAGYYMWPGPYGEWGSRKYLISSCNQSLERLGIEYVDIFYSHRFDPETPLEETMGALDSIVRQGKALYAGISNYNPEQTRQAAKILTDLGTPCVIHQPKYSMFDRTPEEGLLDVLGLEGIGSIVFSPLAQGLLTDRYLRGIPADSRASKATSPFLSKRDVSKEVLDKIVRLNKLAERRHQTLAQMAIAWLLKDERITSVLVGASSPKQLADNAAAIRNLSFSDAELAEIDTILK
ncbi:MAG: aldo/keto reductase [Bacteroidales bacterium]|nr:aldo/keto reductase [Bacteroidales bacterium]